MSDETESGRDGRSGNESTTTPKDWEEIKDPKGTQDLLRKLREENRRMTKAQRDALTELEVLRQEKAEREAEADQQREAKLREQQKLDEIVKDREGKLSKKDAEIARLKAEFESFKTETCFGRHVNEVASKAGIRASLVKALLRDAGGGDIKQFAAEDDSPELVEQSIALLRDRAPELFSDKGNSGGSPLTPMLNSQTKAPGEMTRAVGNMTKEQRAAYYRERGKQASQGHSRRS